MDMETQIREALARGYCSPKNSHKELDAALIESMTQEILQSFTPKRTGDLISDIQTAQVEAGEQAVMDNLKRMGF